MYAVISSGGKQYKVAEGEIIKLEKLSAEVGEILEFPVLLLANEGANVKLGAPFLTDSKVKASVLEHGRGDKITVINKLQTIFFSIILFWNRSKMISRTIKKAKLRELFCL